MNQELIGNATPILLTSPPGPGEEDEGWAGLLLRAGVNFHPVTALDDFRERVAGKPPPLLLVDLAIDATFLDAVGDILTVERLDRPVFVVALLPDATVSAPTESSPSEAIELAYAFGADDYLTLDQPAEAITQRLRFAFRHALEARDRESGERAGVERLRRGDAVWIWDQGSNVVYLSEGARFLFNAGDSDRLTDFQGFLDLLPVNLRFALGDLIRRVGENGETQNLSRWTDRGAIKGYIRHRVERKTLPGGKYRIKGAARLAGEPGKEADNLLQRDPLTGLYSRAFFEDRLTRALTVMQAQAGQEQEARGDATPLLGMMILNIDRFRRIAASYNQKAIDGTIKECAGRLEKILRKSGDCKPDGERGGGTVLAYLGGDEYGLFLPDLKKIKDIATLAERMLKTFAKPYLVEVDEIYLTASIGIAAAPVDGNDTESMMRHAHSALSHAKAQAENSYQFYSKALAVSAFERLTLESRLKKAIEAEELDIRYQPQVDITSRRIEGVEALVRWRHPEYGLMSPDSFIAVAEEAGITTDIGDWVLERAIRDCAVWSRAGVPPLQVSVNVSADMFRKDDPAGRIADALEATGFDARRLTLELTESLIMEDLDSAMQVMNRLKAQGVKLALDDFGTGYSSLNYLKTLPFDYLKIDRSFIADMETHASGTAMVRAIIGMAKTLDMAVIAEGVETEEQLETLVEEGCDLIQGYLFSGPVTSDELLVLLRNQAGATGAVNA
jgi:diguanylate cyclase (GGDEF)-like protein